MKHGILFLDLTPRVERQDDGRRVLLEPWRYRDVEVTIRAPVGFVTDYSSVPHRLASFMPPWHMIDLAGIAHDYLYREPPFSKRRRALADRVWWRIALAQGNSRYSAWKGWAGLKLFGWLAYGRRNRYSQGGGVHYEPS